MNCGCIILQLLLHRIGYRTFRNLATLLPSLRGNDKSDLTGRVCRYRRVRVFDATEGGTYRFDQGFDQLQMQPHTFTLGAHDTTLTQTLVHCLIERCFEQDGRRTDGIGRVRYDHIELIKVFF